MHYKSRGMSRIQIREIAWGLRESFNIDCLAFPVVEFIEGVLPELVDDFRYLIVEDTELKGVYALTNPNDKTMYITQSVYEGAVKNNPRDRFTLCHEIGHMLLHTKENINLARGEVVKYEDPEWQANVFAAELMAPKKLLKNKTPEYIAENCKMSFQAAKIQASYY